MINSLKNYLSCFGKLSRSKVGRKLIMAEINKKTYLSTYAQKVTPEIIKKALKESINWLEYNQTQSADQGFGTYYLCEGWTSSYPETTGYIVPSLLNYSEFSGDKKYDEISREALDWLLSIQKESGGWQSGYIHQNKDEVVFNTGQVIRGMVAGYKKFKNHKYLESAASACDWLCKIQNPNGSFDQHVYLGKSRVYDSYVVAPMLEVYDITNNDDYKNAAIKNIDWIINGKQLDNGWFEDCDNTIKHNNKPILHTIAYTIDGILDCATYLKDQKYMEAAVKPADKLLSIFMDKGTLKGRWDQNWNGSEALITTGCAQMSIIWEKLYSITQDSKYKSGYQKMNQLLVAIHQRNVFEPENSRGAIFGSFPFWGKYEKFGCPNWATKYLIDALIFDLDNQ